MQRHRASRLAVLLNLRTIDSQPNGVERTAGCIKPAPAGMLAVPNLHGDRNSSTTKLMETCSSENSIGGSSIGGSDTGGESQQKDSEPSRKSLAEGDSCLEMSIDVTEAANALRFGTNAESVLDEGDITSREKAGDSECKHHGASAAMNGSTNRLKGQNDDHCNG